MAGIIQGQIEEYLDSLLPARDAVLREMERYAARHRIPIVGPPVPACSINLRVSSEPTVVLAIGYSTLWLARAVGSEGAVYYTDDNTANACRAEAYLKRAQAIGRVRLLTGDALTLLDSVEGEFDIIFNDVNKEQDPSVVRRALPRRRVGGLLISDNVLWSGRTARPAARGDSLTPRSGSSTASSTAHPACLPPLSRSVMASP